MDVVLEKATRRTAVDPNQLAQAYADCAREAKSHAKNFYYAFLTLDRSRRAAMCALYTFLRRTDDLGDCPDANFDRMEALTAWRGQLRFALDPSRSFSPCPADTPSGPSPFAPVPAWCDPQGGWWLALVDTVERYGIAPEHLEAVIDGVESDLVPSHFQTMVELEAYCWRVASAVGLACIRIWGVTDPRATSPAEALGVAFQLTNILRDLAEDWASGRLYLPLEDLQRFGLEPADLGRRDKLPALVELIRFETARAETYYAKGRELLPFVPPRNRSVLRVMIGLYHGILRKIARRPERIFEERVSLSKVAKCSLVLCELPARWIPQLYSRG